MRKGCEEECDLLNSQNGVLNSGCTSDCKITVGFYCSENIIGGGSIWNTRCGDFIIAGT